MDARSAPNTSDGRSDFGNATAFARAGVQSLPLDPKRFAKIDAISATLPRGSANAAFADLGATHTQAPEGADAGRAIEADPTISVKGTGVDLLEVSLFSFFVDAVIDCNTTAGAKTDWITELHHWLLGKEVSKSSPLANLRQVHKVFAKRAQGLFGDPSTFYIQKDHKMDVDNLKPFNIPFLLGQVAQLSPKTFELHLVGDGPQKQLLEELTRKLRIASAVTWHGWLPAAELLHVYQSLDCLVNPSLYEGMSNVVLEAMACGLPVIASRVPGNEEVVLDRETGFLFHLGEPATLLSALAQLRDPNLRRRMGISARNRAMNFCSWNHTARQYAELFPTALPAK